VVGPGDVVLVDGKALTFFGAKSTQVRTGQDRSGEQGSGWGGNGGVWRKHRNFGI
jgi:hypothetical protein